MSFRVLVVEDDFMNKVLVKEMLTLNGFIVIEAGDGKEAVRMAVSESPDVILMDLHLPEMDGIRAMKTIKEDKGQRMPIIALTASAMLGDEEKILNYGFDGYVPKPIELKRLVNSVKDAIKLASKK
ncbi:MAG: response regulator [Deltaproteobacteria bacterium]|nr:response regulator [Deltaproteobacteria bacterium]